jgi:hypothetical protein
MARYAVVITASGIVDNMIEYDGVSPLNPGTGMELREADANAEIGGTWNGSAFVRAVVPTPTRTQVLMYEVTNPIKEYDGSGDPVNKTADEIAAEKLELKNLLTASLVGTEDAPAVDLDWEQTQTLLRLERE